ncbi:MAG: GEVED domain-containing protein [Pseudomonadota bacterium]
MAFNGKTVSSGRTTGYSYRDLSASVVLSVGTQSLSLTPKILLRNTFVGWSAWIDFDGDGTFSSSELVASSGTDGKMVTRQIEIPSTVVGGKTRIRFAMQRKNYPSSCGTFTYGEVEDYDVTIKPETWSQTVEFENVFGQAAGVTLSQAEESHSVRIIDGVKFDGQMFDNYDPLVYKDFPYKSDWICFSLMTVTFPRPVLKIAFSAGHRWLSGASNVYVIDNQTSSTLASYLPQESPLQVIEAKASTMPFQTIRFASMFPTRPCIDKLQIKYAP